VKKFLLIIMMLFLLCGCGKDDEKTVTEKFQKKLDKCSGYNINAILTIYKDENVYTYDVESSYSNKDYYKVSLKNQNNGHEQIILKNNDGVYLLTPSLRKSFKFQSEWPYNNSQIYILQTLLNDILNDDKRLFESKDDQYVYTTSVKYSNDPNLNQQKIYFDKEINLTKVEIMNSEGNIKMLLEVNEIIMDKKYEDSEFKLDDSYNQNYNEQNKREDSSNNEVKEQSETESSVNQEKDNTESKECTDNSCEESESNRTSTTASLNQIVYPMYIPTDTYLSSQDKVSNDGKERVILTFAGESPFILVQESSTNENPQTEYVSGEPEFIIDTIGAVNEYSVTWNSGNVDYYLMSDNLTQDELITIAQSVNVLAVSK